MGTETVSDPTTTDVLPAGGTSSSPIEGGNQGNRIPLIPQPSAWPGRALFWLYVLEVPVAVLSYASGAIFWSIFVKTPGDTWGDLAYGLLFFMASALIMLILIPVFITCQVRSRTGSALAGLGNIVMYTIAGYIGYAFVLVCGVPVVGVILEMFV